MILTTTEEMLLQLIEGQKQLADDLAAVKAEQKQMADDLSSVKDDLVSVKDDLASFKKEVNNRFDKVDNELEELKEHAHITRSATNGLIEKMEDFVSAYNELHSPEFKF